MDICTMGYGLNRSRATLNRIHGWVFTTEPECHVRTATLSQVYQPINENYEQQQLLVKRIEGRAVQSDYALFI